MAIWYEVIGIVILVIVILLLLKKLFKGLGEVILDVLSEMSAGSFLYILLVGLIVILGLYLFFTAPDDSQNAQNLLHFLNYSFF